ncbi:MAG TPA: lytic murein transglycosylase B [Gammaproteobacteria bacterium]|nr:lytic murein transglycosylase B [Gammaproteobacteria bacterium]
MMVRSGKSIARFLIVLLAASLTAGAARAQDAAQARQAFIARMVAEHGFDRGGLDALFAGVEINDSVLQAIARPAERVLAWHEYRDIFVTDARVSSGVEFWSRYAEEIDAAAERYGVAPEIIVAIVGIETWFGTRMGRYRVLESLSTLAFAYPPRARFFASELESFLLLTREEGIDPMGVLGSYAGAMGAGQFIPTSFRAYAVDANADGRRDLWTDWVDVLGSVANYFKAHGWRDAEPVVVRATLRPGAAAPEPPNSMDLNETVGSLTQSGYVFPTELPASTPATVLGLDGRDGREYWVGYHNFRVITRYNRSVMYALAAQQLADAIVAAMAQPASAADTRSSKEAA